MRQHAHRGEVVQLGDAVPGVELQRAYVELVERVLSRVPVDYAARAVDVRASFLRTRNADGEERNAKALKCGIAVAPGPERTRRLRWRRGLLAREPLRGLARVVRQPGPTARRPAGGPRGGAAPPPYRGSTRRCRPCRSCRGTTHRDASRRARSRVC